MNPSRPTGCARWGARAPTATPRWTASTASSSSRLAARSAGAAGSLRIAGPEADDLAHQSAGDALMAISEKIGQFRGESRFTTWAYKFVMLEVSTKIGRHVWRDRGPALDTEEWARLPDRIGLGPSQELEWRDLVTALRRAIDDGLTAHQRRIFVAVVLDEVPMDALAVQLGSNRNAIYKALFDARRKLRAHLVGAGYLPPENAGRA